MTQPATEDPTAEERLEHLREYAHNGLRYLGTAYHRLQTGAWTPPFRPKEEEASSLLNEMRTMAHVMAFVDGVTDLRAVFKAGEGIVERYLREVEHEPWTPEEGQRRVRRTE